MIVGEHEADIKRGRISIGAPVARALIGKDVGDTVNVQSAEGQARGRGHQGRVDRRSAARGGSGVKRSAAWARVCLASLSIAAALLAVALPLLGVMASCKQGEGERCQVAERLRGRPRCATRASSDVPATTVRRQRTPTPVPPPDAAIDAPLDAPIDAM